MQISIFNMECPICTDIFKTTDDIYSTSCGHIFHNNCLTEWNTRSSSCPKCCASNPTKHKIYLSFNEIELNCSETITEMELKLKSANEEHIKVLDKLNEIEFNFMQIQEQFTISEREKKNLEERIKEMNDSEENFLHLQGQYTESLELNKYLQNQIHELSIENERINKEIKLKCKVIKALRAELQAEERKSDNIQNDKIKDLEKKLKYTSAELEQEITSNNNITLENQCLKDKINELSIENESISKELILKCNVIESLRAEMDAVGSISPDNIQNEKIRILEQKLKYTFTELEKEIATNSNLTIENFKLQSYIDHLKSSDNIKNITSKKTNLLDKNENNVEEDHCDTNRKHINNNTTDREVKENKYENQNENNVEEDHCDTNRKHINNNTTDREVKENKYENQNENNIRKDNCDKNQQQITNVTANQVVIEDLSALELTLPLENIIVNLARKMNISITPDDLVSVTTSNHKMLVKFKTAQSKNEFLSKRHFLKNYDNTRSINIREYIDDEIETLLTYTQLELKDYGFNHIFLRNKQIYVKKHRKHPKIIRIRSKDHVDSLKEKIQSLESESNTANDFTEKGIDENYYQL